MPVRLREQGLRDDFIAAYDELQTLLGREWGIDYACQRNICSFSAFYFLDTFFMVGYSDIFEMLLFRGVTAHQTYRHSSWVHSRIPMSPYCRVPC